MKTLRIGTTLLLLLLLSCNEKSTEPPVGDPGGTAVTKTILPGGGTITATTGSAASVTVTFPAGAVPQPTEITLRPVVPSAGLIVEFELEPAGMIFSQPFTMDVVLPGDGALGDLSFFLAPGADTIALPTTVDVPSRTLTTTLGFFGFRPDSLWALPGKTVPRPLAVAGTGNNVGIGTFDCDAIARSTQRALDGMNAIGTTTAFRHAIALSLNTASLLITENCPQYQTFLDQVEQLACDGLGKALQDATAASVTGYGDFARTLAPVVEWFSVAQKYTNTCSHDPMAVIAQKVTEFSQFFSTRLGTLAGQDFSTFQNLRGEAQEVFRLRMEAGAAGLYDAADLVRDQAFEPAVENLRNRAYELCGSDNWHYPLTRMTSTGFFAGRDIVNQPSPRPGNILGVRPPNPYASFTDDDIFEDLQYCATAMMLRGIATSGTAVDTATAGGTGSPGSKDDHVEFDCPTRGKIFLGGLLQGFVDWTIPICDPEVIVALNGTDVLTLTHSTGSDNFLSASPEELDIAAAALTAGITPKEGTSHELTIRRKRTTCDQRLWGDTEYIIVTATLNWKNPTLTATIDYPGQVEPGVPTPATIIVGVVDQFGIPAMFADIDISLVVAGGTAAQTTGTTDASGRFTTLVTATNPTAFTLFSAASAGNTGNTGSNGSLGTTIDATARSFEGVTATATATAAAGGALVTPVAQRVLAFAEALSDTGPTVYDVREVKNDTFINRTLSAQATSDAISASASLGVTFQFEGANLKVISSSGTSSSSGFAGGTPGSGIVQNIVEFVVSGDSIAYVFSGSHSGDIDASGGAKLIRYVSISGGGEENLFFTANASFNESGVLAPGRYGVTYHAETHNGSASGNYTFTISPP